MAAIYSRLIHCLSTSRSQYSRQTIRSIQFYLIKSQTLRSLGVPLSNCSIAPFCSYSQGTSEHSIGRIKKQAELGFKKGGENYDAYRPSYTDESVNLIVSEIVSTISTAVAGLRYDVLELGAGTGKMTDRLSKKVPGHIRYLATDPSENFLDVLKGKSLSIDVASASADSIPLEDKSVSSVVCAQSFHWFCDKEDIESIHRVLVPGGKLILIFNMKNYNHEWMVQFYKQRMEVINKIGRSMTNVIDSMEWRKELECSPLFKLKWYMSLPGISNQGDLETVISSLTASSAYNSLPQSKRDSYLDQLRQIIMNWPDFDLNNITIPYTTELYVYTAQ